MRIEDLNVKLFADGANLPDMLDMAAKPYISGFTTNPTLMRKAGIADYTGFAHVVLAHIQDRPVSFEVFSDDCDEMYRQAKVIQSWGENVYIKIPVTNTQSVPTYDLVRRLTHEGAKLNITAVFTLDQVARLADVLRGGAPAFVSVFAGRIADTGIDPIPVMQTAKALLHDLPQVELLWASPRELLNVIQADAVGCDIITATPDVLKKLANLGKDLETFSLETVQMFYDDAQAAGYEL